MSHIVEITTKITDLDALKSACDELGFVFLEDQRDYSHRSQLVFAVLIDDTVIVTEVLRFCVDERFLFLCDHFVPSSTTSER